MICLLLIMIMIFVKGLENAEPKTRILGSILSEEEMDAKTKAWLLMVESGKVDEEELRRITPKSIFIAPLLSGRTEKCKEGYRHDHLGQCVKVIKLDPKVQLELLLKRLNTLYSEKKQEDKELSEISSGPLHFSIPISNEEKKEGEINNEDLKYNSNITEGSTEAKTEHIPVPLPIILTNKSHETKEIESSGVEPHNDTEFYMPPGFEGSGFTSGDGPPEDETSSISLLPEDIDYLDVNETETITDILPTTEITTSSPLTTNSTESYQSITDVLSYNDSVVELTKENVQNRKNIKSSSKIHFPSEEELRTHENNPIKSDYIRFPDDTPQPQPFRYHSHERLTSWDSQLSALSSSIPHQQFWWLPESWKVDNNQQKSTLVKFWSRLPLIHDISFGRTDSNLKKPLQQNQSLKPLDTPYSPREELNVNSNYQQLNRRGKVFRSNNFFSNDEAMYRQNFRNER